MKEINWKVFALVLSLMLLVAACGGDAAIEDEIIDEAESVVDDVTEEEAEVDEPEAEEPVVDEPEEEMDEPAGDGDAVEIRWYVGLGAGSDEPTFACQEEVVEEFNASQDDIELMLEIVANDAAYDTLATQIAAGNAPDIVGPVGIRGRDSFRGAWLDLAPLVQANDYDLSDFDPNMVDFYRVGDQLLGLPFAVFPSFVLYNQDLFDEAGLAYPPQEYGAPYVDADGEEHPWNIETLTELAMQLTVDAEGNDATSPDFDPENIVQFGYGEQWTDARGVATLFGSGSLVDEDGNAQIPADWEEAWKWVYDGMWEDYFYPNGPYGGSDILGAGNWFESGNMAMAHTHLWYVGCCMGNLDADWNTAAVPAHDDTITAKMHADTFEIMRTTEHPEEAFTVMTYLIGDAAQELTECYGGMPARLSLQPTYFDEFAAENFPDQDVNWDVVVDSMAYADSPNHEAWMPAFQETNDKYNEYWNRWVETPGLDMDAEIDNLLVDLQRIFEAAQANEAIDTDG
ncbi:MAG: extracellular solute-binding protein [Candidatus Promineifilaceae bacterium]|nr:extracellular solute-binding protein [Candidatus Promineifilaceae bacterium]